MFLIFKSIFLECLNQKNSKIECNNVINTEKFSLRIL